MEIYVTWKLVLHVRKRGPISTGKAEMPFLF